MRRSTSAPEPLRTLRPAALVARMLEKHPERRYRNGTELAADLTRIHQKLRTIQLQFDEHERFVVLCRLSFFRGVVDT